VGFEISYAPTYVPRKRGLGWLARLGSDSGAQNPWLKISLSPPRNNEGKSWWRKKASAVCIRENLEVYHIAGFWRVACTCKKRLRDAISGGLGFQYYRGSGS
jgi:hypothetical protein